MREVMTAGLPGGLLDGWGFRYPIEARFKKFSLLYPRGGPDDEVDRISELFDKETKFTISLDGLELPIRQYAISIIFQKKRSYNLDSRAAYLAIVYADFIFHIRGPGPGDSKSRELLSIGCLSLASKMLGGHIHPDHLQGEGESRLSESDINGMELMLLGDLNWRACPITPFSFFVFFLSSGRFHDSDVVDDEDLYNILRRIMVRASETLFYAQNEIRLSYYRPSIAAAAALLSATRDRYPEHFNGFCDELHKSPHVAEEKLRGCYDLMRGVVEEMTAAAAAAAMVDGSQRSDGTGSLPIRRLKLKEPLDDHDPRVPKLHDPDDDASTSTNL